MLSIIPIFFVLTAIPYTYQASAATGTIELDEISFHKVINKFDASLVKFDVAFPYGDKHDAFVALAEDAQDIDELLIAEVGVKDYGEKDNEKLAEKYGATKTNFPVVKLFIRGKTDPITFNDGKGFTSEELRKFVRKHTNIYLSLPGCIMELDQLAGKFMKANKDDRKGIKKDLEDYKVADKDKNSKNIYKTIMEKVLEKGDSFAKVEDERVRKLLDKKVSEEKKKELGIRLNILQSFIILENLNKEEL